MDWDKIIGYVGLPGAIGLALLIAGKLGYWDWGRVASDLREDNRRLRAENKELRDEMAEREEKHRIECDRIREMNRLEVQRWQDMAIQNNVIAMRNATNVDRATDIAEKVVEKVAPPSQQTPP